ncbi:VOC family protein [Streptomyces sp. JUS-F4]|uniref:VOC family protein n=1 Tax=Streptomyces sp. JUS-F4 TaxID=2951988 RepID=UPI002665609F|nr:VOC family protein [Streptomyces sp. JUS-F4]WKN15784.1 VOC family protein [Streptomyces sp. JUS-F4]
MNPLNASIASTAWTCDNPQAMADFYHQLTGWPIMSAEDTHAIIGTDDQMLVFAHQEDFTAPNWPADTLPFHLDFRVKNTEAAVAQLLKAGGTKPDFQPGEDQWTVLLDPSGQPLCISSPQDH